MSERAVAGTGRGRRWGGAFSAVAVMVAAGHFGCNHGFHNGGNGVGGTTGIGGEFGVGGAGGGGACASGPRYCWRGFCDEAIIGPSVPATCDPQTGSWVCPPGSSESQPTVSCGAGGGGDGTGGRICETLPVLGGSLGAGGSSVGGALGAGGSASSGSGGASGTRASFASPTSYPAGGIPSIVTLADMDGDGHLDVVMVTASSDGSTHQLSLLLNKGDGTFAAPRPYSAARDVGPYLAVGDVNGDGKPDVAITNASLADAASSSVDVWLNNGNGGLITPSDYSIAGLPTGLVLADVDGDGRNDVVALSQANLEAGGVTVLSNRGDGTFAAARSFSVGKQPSALAAGDLNGDGRVDLAVVDAAPAGALKNDLSVLLNQGGGNFAVPVVYPGGDTLRGVALADLDGDGHLDVAVLGQYADLNVLINNGDGTFADPAFNYQVPWVAFALGDVTGDGRIDIVGAAPLSFGALGWVDGDVSVLVNRGSAPGIFNLPVHFADEPVGGSIALGDVNGDGKLDVVAANHSYNCFDSVSVLLNSSP